MSLIKIELAADLISYRWPDSQHPDGYRTGDFAELSQSLDNQLHWQVQLLWPVESALVTQVPLPPGKGAGYSKMLPFIVEEFISQDIDSCQIFPLSKPVDRKIKVAVLDKARFEQIQDDFAGAEHLRLASLSIDALQLEVSSDEPVHVFMDEESVWVNCQQTAFRASSDQLDFLLQKLVGEQFKVSLTLAESLIEQKSMITANIENLEGFEVGTVRAVESKWQWLQTHALTQSLFQQKAEKSIIDHLMPLTWAAAVLLVIMTVALNVRAIHLGGQADEIFAKTQELYVDVMGAESRFRPARFKQTVQETITGQSADAGFLYLFGQFSDAFQTVKNLDVDSVNFNARSQVLNVSIETNGYQPLEQLKNRLQDLGLTVDSKISENGNRATGSFTISKGDA